MNTFKLSVSRFLLLTVYYLSYLVAQFMAGGELGQAIGLPYLAGGIVVMLCLVRLEFTFARKSYVLDLLRWPRVRHFASIGSIVAGTLQAAHAGHWLSVGWLAGAMMLSVVMRYVKRKWQRERQGSELVGRLEKLDVLPPSS